IGAEEATEKIQNMLATREKLAAFSQGLSGLGSAFEEFQENKFVSAETLNSLPDAFKSLEGYDVFSQIVGDPKSGTQKIQNAFDQIVSEYLQSQNILDDATSQNKNEIIANLQQAGIGNAENLVNSYMNSMEENKPLIQGASDEILQYLSNNNEADVNNFIAALQAKNANYTELASVLGEDNATLVAKFGSQYGDDLANWITQLEQKEEAYNQFVQEYNNSVEKQQNDFDKLGMPVERAVANGTADTTILTQNAKDVSTSKQNMDNAGKDYENTKQETTKKIAGKLAKLQGKINVSGYHPKSPAGSNNTNNNNNNTTPKETKRSFDWLDRRISVLTNKLDFLKAKIENVFSVQNKNSIIDKEIKKTNALINTYKKQEKIYKAKAKKSARSDKDANDNDKAKLTGKKGKKLKQQIQNGQIKGSKKQWIKAYDEKTANAIEEYQNYWDKYQTARKNRQDALKTKQELKIQKRQNWVDYYDSVGNSYDARIDTAATAKAKNTLEKDKLSYIKKSYDQQIKIADLEEDSVKAATLLAQKWKEIADTRERILQYQLDENANKRDYNNAAYENADNAGKKSLIQKNIASYNSDNIAYADNVNSAQKDVGAANRNVSKAGTAVTSQMKKEGLNESTMKEIQSYISKGEKIPDNHLSGTQVMLPELYKKLVAYNNSIDAAEIAGDALTKAQENQQKALEENATAIREERSKSIQLDIDAANNQNDRLTAEYANLTSAETKNQNIDAQLQQQKEIYKLNKDKLRNDITDPTELDVALAKEDAEWKATQREQTVLKLQNLADEESAQYALNQQKEANANSAEKKNQFEVESRKHLKAQYDYEMQIAIENEDKVEQERLSLELEQKIEESYQRQIDNIREEYDLIIGMNNARKSTIDAQIAALQANGYGIGTDLYKMQIALDKESYQKSIDEIERISEQLPNLTGNALKEAERELESEKQAAWGFQQAIAESQQAINDINLGKFERLKKMLEYIANDLEYMQTILSHSDFTFSDKEIGGLTMEGLSNIALDFGQISNNAGQISNLYDQIAEKQRQLNSGKYTGDGDQISEEIDALLQQIHDLESANYDLGKSIKNAVIDSLNSLADALGESISKYKDALQAKKDLYDYNKKIVSQLKSIASIEKQLAALQGSDTEEARARIQKLQLELEDEQQNLKDMEYDKYIQDQEEMLDKVSDDFQEFIANVSEMSVSDICKGMKSAVLDNLDEIKKSIQGAFDESKAISNLGTSMDGLTKALNSIDYAGKVDTSEDEDGNTHYKYTDDKGNKIDIIIDNNNNPGSVVGVSVNGEKVDIPEKDVANTGKDISNAVSGNTNLAKKYPTFHPTSPQYGAQKIAGERYNKELEDIYWAIIYFLNYASSSFNGCESRMSWDPLNQYIYPKYNKMLDPDEEDALLEYLSEHTSMNITGDSSDKNSLTKVVNKMKELGFSKGGVASKLNKIALANGDDGWATLKRGESVLTPAQTEQFQKLTENLIPLNMVANSVASLPGNPVPTHHSPAANATTVRNVDIHLDGSHVMDADSFIQTLHNPRVLREVSSGVSSQLNSVMSNKLGNF
ncbi:MAG: hypothetical protein K2K70_04925, partial [Lachnospiraceae bacterium]|nr:hypothetical protein [Lachnospiraceae bacterium]